MLKFLKKILPKPIKKVLISLKRETFSKWTKKRLFNRMQLRHSHLLHEIKGKKKIRVIFLAIHKSVWKVDPVFQRMLKDPFFEPEILVCPNIAFGEERMLEDMELSYAYFFGKGYPVKKAKKEDRNWVTLEELQPDIIFFTNPHNITRKEYYEDAYLNYLSCYVSYHHEVGLYGGNEAQYNQDIHNAFWKNFAPHQCSKNTYKEYCASRDTNVSVTGYPACEELYLENTTNIWKPQEKKKLKIIWAPHHTIINEILPYSNFLEYADMFVDLITNSKDTIQWAFKPHPILKSNLYLHPNWGKKRTDLYYQLWAEGTNSQLEEGEYNALFQQSDAMIHDSGSFLAEYIYLKKPVLYTVRTENYKSYYNEFGLLALSSIKIARNMNDISEFVNSLVANEEIITSKHTSFIKKNIDPFFSKTKPSEVIVNLIKNEFQNNEK